MPSEKELHELVQRALHSNRRLVRSLGLRDLRGNRELICERIFEFVVKRCKPIQEVTTRDGVRRDPTREKYLFSAGDAMPMSKTRNEPVLGFEQGHEPSREAGGPTVTEESISDRTKAVGIGSAPEMRSPNNLASQDRKSVV